MNSDHTKIEPLTRASVLRDIVQALTALARGRLTVTEIEGAVDSVLPTFEAIAATAVQGGDHDQQRLLAALSELGGPGSHGDAVVTGLVVNHAGCLMDLFPSDGGWRAYETLDDTRMDEESGELTAEAVGHGATPLEALKACAAETRRL